MGASALDAQAGCMKPEPVTPDSIVPDSIVVGIDGSDDADLALTWAAEQADLTNRPLAVVHVIDDRPIVTLPRGPVLVPQDVLDAGERAANGLLPRAASQARGGRPDLRVTTHVRHGDPRRVLLELADHAHLLVLGSRGRGPVRSLLLGSVSATASRHAACPVVVTRPGSPEDVRHGILVGADGTPASRPVLEFAFRQASLRGLPLTAMHCFWDLAAAYGADPEVPLDSADAQGHRRQLEESVAAIAEKFPDVPVTTRLNRGAAQDRLTRGRRHWDLVVVGHHSRRGLARFLIGSTAIGVLERAHGTVAVVPEAEVDLVE